MAASAISNQINVLATGASDHISLPPGDHILLVTAGGWGSSNLQVGDGVRFVDAKETKDGAPSKVVFTEDDSAIVPGGVAYRLRTTSYTNEITLTASRVQNKG